MSEALVVAILAFMLISAIVAVSMKDVLSSVIALKVFGVLLTILFVMMQAPDVALTQAVINSGLLPALFLVSYSRIRKTDQSRRTGPKPQPEGRKRALTSKDSIADRQLGVSQTCRHQKDLPS